MREFFLAGYLELKDQKERIEEEFDIKYAEWEKEARDNILKEREIIMGKSISSTTLNVSKDEIKNYVLRTYEEEYQTYTEKLRSIKKAETLLYETYRNFYQRATELQSIFKAKQPNNFEGEIRRTM